MGKYISAYTGAEIDAAVAKLANQTLSTIDTSIAYTQSQQAIKKYVALISQAGSANPVATVLENTIGDIVWTRFAQGRFRATLAGAFTTNKTYAFLNDSNPPLIFDTPVDVNKSDYKIYIKAITSQDLLEIRRSYYDATEGILIHSDDIANTSIEIRVYP